MSLLTRLKTLKRELEEDLYAVINFWLKYSIDKKCGGYFNCLASDGEVYDTTKHGWLQCRQLWMLTKLYKSQFINNSSNQELKKQIKEAADNGIDFIVNKLKFMDTNTGIERVYFSVTREGNGISVQRKIFSECFFVMSLFGYASITENEKDKLKYINIGFSMFKNIIRFINESTLLGIRPSFAGTRQFGHEPLNIPMITLNIVDEIRTLFPNLVYLKHKIFFDEITSKCVNDIISHVDNKNKCIREHVLSDGRFDDVTSMGRVLTPGHAIECGWFLLEFNRKHGLNNEKINDIAKNMIEWSFNKGWDTKFYKVGGLIYYMDALDKPVTFLEGDMKLWWPISEAMIAYALLFEEDSTNKSYFNKLENSSKFALKYLSDKKNGGWFGYLNRNGNISLTFKGGPYKGFFHVPRGLLYTIQILQRIETKLTNNQKQSKL